MTKLVKKKSFSIGWNPTIPPVKTTSKFKNPREWQKRVFNTLANERDVIINAPTASGKSLAICFMLSHALGKNKKMRAIVSVPQTIIADGFKTDSLLMPNGEEVDWTPSHYLCDDKKKNSNISQIKSFLEKPRAEFIADRTLVCSHASLVKAFKRFPSSFKNTKIVIDEAHHILFGQSEEDDELEITNGIGNIVKYAIDNDLMDISIWLTTATFFRGDKNPILPPKYTDRFKRFDLPYDEFLPDCYPLEKFSFDFLLYKNKYKTAATELFKQKIGKTIVYIPTVNSRYTVGDKHDDVEEIYKAIGGEKYKKKEDGVLTLIYSKKHKKWVRCLNLVDESDRDKKKELIFKAHKSDNANDIDVLITLNMFIEGANWKWGDRELIIGKRGSLNAIVQIIGRLFRSAPSKKLIEIYYLLPHARNVKTVNFKENFNDYYKAILASMMLLRIMSPKLICAVEPRNNSEPIDNSNVKYVDYLTIAFPDENTQSNFIEECQDELVRCSDDNNIPIKGVGQEDKEKLNKSLDVVLDDFGVKEHREELKAQIIRWFTTQSVMLDTEGLDVNKIDIDLIKESTINPCAYILGYTSGYCGINTFQEYRAAVDRSREAFLIKVKEWAEWDKKQRGEDV